MNRCIPCEGTGWLRREKQHPCFVDPHPVTFTRPCPDCKGTGHNEQPSLFKTVEVTA